MGNAHFAVTAAEGELRCSVSERQHFPSVVNLLCIALPCNDVTCEYSLTYERIALLR